MKRVLTFVLIIAAACCMAEKAAVRIDIDGRADQIELKTDVCQNVAMDNPGWMGDKKQFYLSAMSKATVGSYWKEFFISFIPQQDGKVRLVLMGPWYKPEKAERRKRICRYGLLMTTWKSWGQKHRIQTSNSKA